MTRRIFRSILLVAGIALLASTLVVTGILYEYFGRVEAGELKEQLSLAAAAVENEGEAYLARVSSESCRFTWIAADGTVMYDTRADAAELENHGEREEVRAALDSGEGESTRYSSTLLQKTVYYARRLSDGTVLRISVSRDTVGVLALGMIQPELVILLAAFIFSGILAKNAAKHIVEPLNSLDLDHPLENEAYEELTPLLTRINSQRRELKSQLRALNKTTDEFTQITGSMKEGLVLLDEHGNILSINSAARRLFAADGDCVGRDFITVERAVELSTAIERAATEGHGETRLSRGGREYQLDVSRIEADGETAGAVILAFDVTEQVNAERLRREFTANVSHELKTPLQGIIGSAELIESGMVAEDDMPRFIGHIRTESARLVTLIDDIIRLSQLDEGEELPFERVELLSAVNEAVEGLYESAAAKSVDISVEGEKVEISAVRRLVYETIYNLCDNAVKYNVSGGSVRVSISDEGKNAVIRVADTGIGIAESEQGRVFERFYRVDKSHSKASGGTGLGLSIVKHAVQYHKGTIELESALGKGTTVTLRLPKGE